MPTIDYYLLVLLLLIVFIYLRLHFAGFIVYWHLSAIVRFCVSSSCRVCRPLSPLHLSSLRLPAPAPSMEVACYLILATAITVICLYLVDYSLWWAIVVPAAALVTWALYHSRHQQKRTERHHRGSTHTYSVPSYRSRTDDERASLLPYSRLPTETSSRIASSQSAYVSRSSFSATPSVLHTAPDSSFRVVVDPGLVRYSTPTVAIDPRLLRYTSPTIPSPVVVDTRRTLPSNPTSASLMAAAERKGLLAQAARNTPAPIPAPVARQEIDGLFLHEAVAAEVDERYLYDQQIKTENNRRSAKRPVMGYFKCYNCKPRKYQLEMPRTWMSNRICVEIWMSSSGHRYRTRLHSQMCTNCDKFVEPEVNKDDYVTKVVKALDRWTGQNSDVKPRQKGFKTGPHRTDKCGACLKGICLVQPAK